MTLWPIDDEATADFIADFYKLAVRSGDASGSLAHVQRQWLSKLRREKGMTDACRIAGPFILSFRGSAPASAP